MQTSLIKLFFFDLVQLQKGRGVLCLVLMLGISLSEGAGLVLLLPLLQIVGLNTGQGQPGALAELVNRGFALVGFTPSLISVLLVGLLITLARALLQRWQAGINFSFQHDFVLRLQKSLYRSMAHADWLSFCRSRSSDLNHALTQEVWRCGAAVQVFLSLVSNLILALVYLVFAMRLSPPMSLIALLAGLILVGLLRRRNRVARVAGEGLSQAGENFHATIAEHLGGMKLAKASGSAERHIARFDERAHEVRDRYRETIYNQAAVSFWFSFSSMLILVVLVYCAVVWLQVPSAELLLLLFLCSRILPRISGLQASYQHLLNLLPAYKNLQKLQAGFTKAAKHESPSSVPLPLLKHLCVEDLSFGYHEAPILTAVNLKLVAGQTTALVGGSGAGKTTLVDLLLGLLKPATGRILVDDQPLQGEALSGWRQSIGYVPQEAFLFHDSIRNNLLWSRPQASEAELWAALELAAARGFVDGLERGLDTLVGERGVRLSGGERQRIALARALLRQPALLILDEATSALDSESESQVQTAIEGLKGQMTILVIAHRFSSVRFVDQIHLLEGGRILESGTPGELLAAGQGRFRTLFDAQLGGG